MLGKGKKMRTAVEVEIQNIHSRTDMCYFRVIGGFEV
jgi:hypothetical protein